MSQSSSKTEIILEKTREKLNGISPSFCLAKWLQVTLHLHNGHTHSCHHPGTHQVPLAELKRSPLALHNTSHNKKMRREMLKGKRPSECNYCWNIEDAPGNHFSDRVIKSQDKWARPFFDDVVKRGAQGDINPTYVEVSFSHACNLRCAYCSPNISSMWEAEIKKFGEYPTHSKHCSLEAARKENKMPFPIDQPNPYVVAFWEWWPDLSKDLKVFRVTGGEPLLVEDTFKVLDWFEHNSNPEMELAFNSNLCVPDKKIDSFIEKSKKILEKKNIRSLLIYTSLDTWGTAAEYLRFGLNLEKIKANIEKVLLADENIFLTFMCTYNMLSAPDFRGLLEYIAELKKRFPNLKGGWPRVVIDISYLRHPDFFAATLLPDHFHSLLDQDCHYMESLVDESGERVFQEYESNKMKRLAAFVKVPLSKSKKAESKKDFARFFNEYDRRRGTDFRGTFPAFNEFYEECLYLAGINATVGQPSS